MTVKVAHSTGTGIATRYYVDLPQLPASWSYQHFADVLDVQGGSQPPKSTFVFEPTPGYIQLLQIRDFGERGVPTYVRENLVTKRCDQDDILIARYGASLGRILTGQSGAYNVALAKVIFDERLFIGKSLFYLLQTPFFQTPLHMISRSAQNGFNKGDLSDIVLPIAPLNEQRRIVAKIEELFSNLDAGVAALERAKANLKRYRAAVLKAAVEGKLTEEWRAKHPKTEPASKLLERILIERREKWEADQLAKFAAAGKEPPKNWKAKYVAPMPPDTTDLPELPERWSWASIEQVAVIVTKGSSPNWQGFDYVASGVPFLRSQNVRWGGLDLRDMVYLPIEFNQKHRNSIIRQGDVLLNLVGASIGRSAVASDLLQGANTNQAVGIIRLIENSISNRLLVYTLLSPQLQTYIAKTKADVARANFNLDDIRPTPIPLPPTDEQKIIVTEIAEKLSQVDAAELSINHELFRAARLRQSILKQAFEGKLVPQDAKDEPASKLLEQIGQNRGGTAATRSPQRSDNGRTKTSSGTR